VNFGGPSERLGPKKPGVTAQVGRVST
jgi:hypothetical protein